MSVYRRCGAKARSQAAEFNKYLPAEGIPDILENRTRDGELDKDARYRYSKYVKTIFQAGNKTTDNYKTILGYAVEMVPQQNPYKLKKGSHAGYFMPQGRQTARRTDRHDRI